MSAYDRDREHLRDGLRRLDLLLQRYLATWRADRGGAGEGGGLYVADEQVDRLLSVPPMGGDADRTGRRPGRAGDGGTTGRAGTTARERGGDARGDATLDNRLRTLDERIRERERATADRGDDLRLVTLTDRFGLTRRHVDALFVALAPELDLKYETVYAYLQDDLTRRRPTAGLVLRIIGGTAGDEAANRALLTPGSPLLDGGLLRLGGVEGAVLSRPVEVDRRIVAYLLGEDTLPRSLSSAVEPLDPAAVEPSLTAPVARAGAAADAIERLPIPAPARDRLAALRARVDGDPPAMIHLDGPYGAGHEAAAAALVREVSVDRPLLTVDAGRLSAAADTRRALVREATLRNAAVLVTNLPQSDDEGDLETLITVVDDCPGPVFLAGEATVPARLAAGLDGFGLQAEPSSAADGGLADEPRVEHDRVLEGDVAEQRSGRAAVVADVEDRPEPGVAQFERRQQGTRRDLVAVDGRDRGRPDESGERPNRVGDGEQVRGERHRERGEAEVGHPGPERAGFVGEDHREPVALVRRDLREELEEAGLRPADLRRLADDDRLDAGERAVGRRRRRRGRAVGLS